jgi:hypothetical protein
MVTTALFGYSKHYDKVYLRGTPNNWGTTLMELVADNTWETEMTFGDDSRERFKFDVYGDWTKNWGDDNNDGICDYFGDDIYVDADKTYTIRFNDTTKEYSVVEKIVNTIPAPEDFELDEVTPEEVKLDWDSMDDADYYEVYRDGEKLDDADKSKYKDKSVEADKVYYYKVRAVVNGEAGNFTEELKAITSTTPIANYDTMYIRGSFNNWGCTEMTLTEHYTWEVEADFTGNINARFKFDPNCDWTDGSFGDTDRDGVVQTSNEDIPAHLYKKMTITLNDETLEYKMSDYKIYPEYEALFNYENLEKRDMQTIKIIMTEDEWNGVSVDITKHLEYFGNKRTSVYRKATFEYTGPAGDITMGEVGFRTRGNTSRTWPQDINGNPKRAAFKIKFNKTFDLEEGTDEYEERKDRRFATMKALNLRWNTNGDTTMIRELYAYNAFNKIGVYTSRITPVRLIVKSGSREMDYGVYYVIEPVDKDFLKKRFGKKHNDGDLYKQSYLADLNTIASENLNAKVGVKEVRDWRYDNPGDEDYRPAYDLNTNEDESDHSALLNFIKNINTLDGTELYNYLEANFEVDRFLRYQALGVLIGSPDDYWSNGNNYHLYFDNDGKASFIPIDYDNSLGKNWVPFDIANSSILTYGHPSNGNRNPVLIDKILSVEQYKEAYQEYVQEYITPSNKVFTWSAYDNLYSDQYDHYKYYLDPDTPEGHTMRQSSGVEYYFYNRTKSVCDQLGLDYDQYETN